MFKLFIFTILLNKNNSFFFNKNNIYLIKKTIMKESKQLYIPKTFNQIVYNDMLNNDTNKIIFSIGPAGTGKTLLACNNAIQKLKNKDINKIILTRPVVPVEEEIGFLPGDINKKMDPWVKPIMDIFLDFYTKKQINDMIFNNIIEIAPLGYIRGRTFKNAFIIADEMQNSSPNQMLMLLTRIGINSKMVITGDLKQSDKLYNSGLSNFINKLKQYNNKYKNNEIVLIEMNNTDIQRNKIIKTILNIYDLNENKAISHPTNNLTTNNMDAALIPLNQLSKNFLNY
jgi:phosphate starvation-inducible PhoH-like protein